MPLFIMRDAPAYGGEQRAGVADSRCYAALKASTRERGAIARTIARRSVMPGR